MSDVDPYAEKAPEPGAERPRHILVLANETVAGKTLLDAIEERAASGPIRVTVVSPQNDPRAGYVVYEDSRRSSAERRLRRTLDLDKTDHAPANLLVTVLRKLEREDEARNVAVIAAERMKQQRSARPGEIQYQGTKR